MRTIYAAILAVAATGCVSTYQGSARLADDSVFDQPGWSVVRGVPLIRQQTDKDCGAAALAMVLSHLGDREPMIEIPSARADALRDAARVRGFTAFCLYAKMQDLTAEVASGRPVVVGMVKPTIAGPVNHYEVVVGLHSDGRVATLDPARGLTVFPADGFESEWIASGRVTIIVGPKESEPQDSSR